MRSTAKALARLMDARRPTLGPGANAATTINMTITVTGLARPEKPSIIPVSQGVRRCTTIRRYANLSRPMTSPAVTSMSRSTKTVAARTRIPTERLARSLDKIMWRRMPFNCPVFSESVVARTERSRVLSPSEEKVSCDI